LQVKPAPEGGSRFNVGSETPAASGSIWVDYGGKSPSEQSLPLRPSLRRGEELEGRSPKERLRPRPPPLERKGVRPGEESPMGQSHPGLPIQERRSLVMSTGRETGHKPFPIAGGPTRLQLVFRVEVGEFVSPSSMTPSSLAEGIMRGLHDSLHPLGLRVCASLRRPSRKRGKLRPAAESADG
jgi:hypothetical protein